jgi:DNA-binding NarL/FixJ family response regulator
MKILVVDDHVLIREALGVVLRELKGEGLHVLEASDSHQAMRQIEDNPDVELVLLDLGLPDRDGFEVLSELADSHPTISVVVHSAHQDRERVMKALDLGALGFVPKSARREVLLWAFNLIFSGGVYIPPEILDRPRPAPAQRVSSTAPVSAVDLGLTERQMQVLALMMQGMSNKAICRALDLAEPTVKIDVSAILKALKAANRTEAVVVAVALGLGPGVSAQVSRAFRCLMRRRSEEGAEALSRRLSVVRSAIGDTGLCSNGKPAVLASRSRSGAVSPVMIRAGIGAPTVARTPAMASMPDRPSARRESEMMTSGGAPFPSRCARAAAPEAAVSTAQPHPCRMPSMASRTRTSSSITSTRLPCAGSVIGDGTAGISAST